MEIERKFLLKALPEGLPETERHHLIQGYLSTNPVLRPRLSENLTTGETEAYVTYKGRGLIAREEYNLPFSKEAILPLFDKCEGTIIRKTRILIPLTLPRFAPGYDPAADSEVQEMPELTAEVDVFEGDFEDLLFAEVEFPSLAMAKAYIPEDWFFLDVTEMREYSNSALSKCDPRTLMADYRKRIGG